MLVFLYCDPFLLVFSQASCQSQTLFLSKVYGEITQKESPTQPVF